MPVKALTPTQLNRYIAFCEEQGLTVVKTKKGVLIRFTDGSSTTEHFTNSDYRAQANQFARFRRSGAVHPFDTRPVEDLPEYVKTPVTKAKRDQLLAYYESQGRPTYLLAKDVTRDTKMVPTTVNQALYSCGFRPASSGSSQKQRVGRKWYAPLELLQPQAEAQPEVEESTEVSIEPEESRPCASCGKDPADGFSSIMVDGVEQWYCHGDDGSSCYVAATIAVDPPVEGPIEEPKPEPEPQPEPEPEPEVAIETEPDGREFIDSVDSWPLDLESRPKGMMLESWLSALAAAGLEYEVRVWRKR